MCTNPSAFELFQKEGGGGVLCASFFCNIDKREIINNDNEIIIITIKIMFLFNENRIFSLQ